MCRSTGASGGHAMLDLGAAGYSILAVSAVAGSAVVGFILLTYAAHCFLTIVVESGCGNDEVRWPREGVVDWLLKPVYCVWLHVPWAALFGIGLLPWLVDDAAAYFILLGCILYVLQPITLLSSLSAKSWVALLYLPFLARWRRWPATFVLVLMLALPLPLAAGLMVEAALAHSFWWALAAALAGPLALLWDARLLGRYGWLVTQTALPPPALRREPERIAGVEVEDPWAGPPPARPKPSRADPGETRALRMKVLPVEALELLDDAGEDEWTPDKKPYGVKSDAPPRGHQAEPLRAPPSDALLGEIAPYRLSAAPILSTPFTAPASSTERAPAAPLEPPTFAQAFGAGLFAFPFHGESLRVWANLAVLSLALLGCVRVLLVAVEEIVRLQ
jgi:hypothetical protein